MSLRAFFQAPFHLFIEFTVHLQDCLSYRIVHSYLSDYDSSAYRIVDSYLPDVVLQGVHENDFRARLSADLKLSLQVRSLTF